MVLGPMTKFQNYATCTQLKVAVDNLPKENQNLDLFLAMFVKPVGQQEVNVLVQLRKD